MTAHGLDVATVLGLFGQPDAGRFNRALRKVSAAMWVAPTRYRPEELRMIASYAKVVGPLDTAPLPGPDVVEVLAGSLRAEHPDLTATQRRRRAEQLLDQAVRARASALAQATQGSPS